MKRKIISALLVLVLCLSMTLLVSAAENTLVFDDADLLSAGEEAALNEELTRLSNLYNAQLIVATVPAVDGGDVDTYVEWLYDSRSFGYGENRDGVLLLVCMNPREYRILSNGFAAQAIEMDDIDSMGQWIAPHLTEGDYAEAFAAFAEECDYYLNGYINGFPFETGTYLFISLVIGVVAGIIVAFVLKGQLKTVHRKHEASTYVKSGSMRLTASNDFFMYRDVTARPKPKKTSSGSGGGSSRNVGGGSF